MKVITWFVLAGIGEIEGGVETDDQTDDHEIDDDGAVSSEGEIWRKAIDEGWAENGLPDVPIPPEMLHEVRQRYPGFWRVKHQLR